MGVWDAQSQAGMFTYLLHLCLQLIPLKFLFNHEKERVAIACYHDGFTPCRYPKVNQKYGEEDLELLGGPSLLLQVLCSSASMGTISRIPVTKLSKAHLYCRIECLWILIYNSHQMKRIFKNNK